MKSMRVELLLAGVLLCGTLCGTGRAGGTACTVGVAECDQYMAKFQSCIEKQATAKTKDAVATALKAQCDSLKQSASTPEGKAGLKKSCQSMLDGLATNLKCK